MYELSNGDLHTFPADADVVTVMVDMTLVGENGNGTSIKLRGTATIEIGDGPPGEPGGIAAVREMGSTPAQGVRRVRRV